MKPPISFIKINKPVFKIKTNKSKFICPRIIKLNNNLYRMYFSKEILKKKNKNPTSIGSAISKDCMEWFIETGDRLKILSDKKYYRLLSPSVIKIKKNLYRMYFEARLLNKRGVIKSALSKDGLNWIEEKGIRIGINKKFSFRTPFCLKKNPNNYELFFERLKYNKHEICLASSTDGYNFDDKKISIIVKQESNLESYSITSPEIWYSRGRYHMYYSAWGGKPLSGKIFYAYSFNKKIWQKRQKPIISPSNVYDQIHCSEPSIVKVKNSWKIFYEGCDKNNKWRILCAQSKY